MCNELNWTYLDSWWKQAFSVLKWVGTFSDSCGDLLAQVTCNRYQSALYWTVEIPTVIEWRIICDPSLQKFCIFWGHVTLLPGVNFLLHLQVPVSRQLCHSAISDGVSSGHKWVFSVCPLSRDTGLVLLSLVKHPSHILPLPTPACSLIYTSARPYP